MNYHSGGTTYSVGDTANVRGPEPRGRQVAHDMEGIFGSAAPIPSSEVLPDPHTIVRIVAPDGRAGRSGSRRTLALSGVVLVGTLAVSIVLALHLNPNPLPRRDALPPIAPPVTQVDRIPASVGSKVVAEALPSTASRRAAAKLAVTAARARLSPAVARPKHEWTRRFAASAPRSHKSTRNLAAKSVTNAPPPHAGGWCDRLDGLDLARCMRPQILDADQQLRDAYQQAIQAGVDRHVLADYRRQWSKLRKRAISDPHSVTTGYRQMARQLDAARTGRLAGDM